MVNTFISDNTDNNKLLTLDEHINNIKSFIEFLI